LTKNEKKEIIRDMKITREQYLKIKKYLPKQRGNVSMSNINLINAILYVAENGCKWRALLKEYGNWHTIYVRLNRWSKNKVLERLFIGLQKERIINVKMEALSIDSTTVKVHPNGTGALKKTEDKTSEGQEEDLQQRYMWLPLLTERLSDLK
jgi:transposase